MYLGNQPALSYTSFAKQDFTTSATTAYTLSQPVANENEIALFINFVRQEPTTAYTASGTSLTLTSATSASDDMYAIFLGKAVQTVNPPAGSVGLSQLSATGTKDSTTFLRGDNTFQAVSSDYVLLATVDASSSATVSFDGYFSSTYKNYIVYWSELYGATDGSNLRIRLRKSNADITGNVYSFIYNYFNLVLSTGSPSNGTGGTGRTSFIRIADWNGDNGGTYRESGYVIIQNANISAYKNITGVSHTFDSNLTTYNATFFNSVLEDSASLSGITFYKDSGNIAAGNFKLYGLK